MEYVDGMSLRGLLDAGQIAPKEALAIVTQICEALQYAHDRGVVHRDIKPENILLNRQGEVKIANFGLAKLMGRIASEPRPSGSDRATTQIPSQSLPDGCGSDDRQTEVEKIMGTPHYMAPEQFETPAEVDHRADIYSLGVVFYQMLTGQLPQETITPPSQRVRIDVRLDEVVLRALEKEPQRRYQQASEVKTVVETILLTPPAGPCPPVTPVPPVLPASVNAQQKQMQKSSLPSAIRFACIHILAMIILPCFLVFVTPRFMVFFKCSGTSLPSLTVQTLYLPTMSIVESLSGVSAAQSQPAMSEPWNRTLSNGVVVELLGVSENPSAGKPWWRPDGSPLAQRPYEKLNGTVYENTEQQAYEIAIRVTPPPGVSYHDVATQWEIASVGSSAGGSAVSVPEMDDGPFVAGIAATLPRMLKLASVRFGVVAGSWKTVETFQPGCSGSSSNGEHYFSFAQAAERDGGTMVSVAKVITPERLLEEPL